MTFRPSQPFPSNHVLSAITILIPKDHRSSTPRFGPRTHHPLLCAFISSSIVTTSKLNVTPNPPGHGSSINETSATENNFPFIHLSSIRRLVAYVTYRCIFHLAKGIYIEMLIIFLCSATSVCYNSTPNPPKELSSGGTTFFHFLPLQLL